MKELVQVTFAELASAVGGYWGEGLVHGAVDVAKKVEHVIDKVPGGRFLTKKAGPVGTAYSVFSAGREWEARKGESTFDRARHAFGAALF